MAMTLRLPGALEAEATVYADSLGLSFTGLVAVALREYLDARPAPKAAAVASRVALPATPQAAAEPGDPGGPSAVTVTQTHVSGNAKLSPATGGGLSRAERRRLEKAQAKRAGGAA